MTEEEAVALGWQGDDLRGYLAGRAAAETALAAIPLPERRTGDAVQLSESEARARALAEQLVARSDALDAVARAGKAAHSAVSDARVAVVERPGEPPSVAQQRSWALSEARRRHPVILRPGPQNEHRDWCLPTGDGRVLRTRQSAAPVTVVIRPEQWEAFDRQYREQERQHEEQILIACWGEQRCRQAGFLA